MTWSQIVNTYRQLTSGVEYHDEIPELPIEHNIKFESMWLRLSTKGISLAGKVSFSDRTSVEGLVSFDESGLTIVGRIDSFSISLADGLGELEIKKARLDIFVGKSDSSGSTSGSSSGVRRTKFAIAGAITWQGVEFEAGVETTTGGEEGTGTKDRRWVVHGGLSSKDGLRVSQLESAKELRGSPLDIALKSVAVIASNQHGDWENPVSRVRYSVRKGEFFSFFPLCPPITCQPWFVYSPPEPLNLQEGRVVEANSSTSVAGYVTEVHF